MVRVNVWSAKRPDISNIRKVPTVNQCVIDLGAGHLGAPRLKMDGLQGSSTNVNRKRRSNFLTLVEKVRIIEDFEAGGGTHDFLGKKYGVGSSTVTRIIQKKEAIREAVDKFKEYGVNNRKTLKEQTFPLLEEALYIWILQQRQSNILLTVDILKAKAELLFKMFQDRGLYAVHGFSASDGWMHRFKQRFGLRVKAVTGEKASMNVEAYLNFKKVLQKKIQEMQLSLSQVFNADESALFIKLLATCSVVTCDETVASGRKQNKTRYKDQVYDADHNPDWVTSEVFSDDEILSSVLKKDQPEMQEEWLVDTEDGSNSFDTSITSTGDPGFGDAIKSIDCLVRYMKHDVAEVCRLNALRSKITEVEWLKRAC
ncbi:tigger transposable element-derived protein 1-like [Toxorhynchites rutilus septentrionalis]|uniref:tigger transposable element-derived protein 1-like n=1 Tax=Toxorhynchites rutilus septentrionalis TaxID=329112 RepID=UPI002478765B|nr:tigger transposable element-derived protein 1-like [Toxorhynchites rutilus septentrionalis]